MRFGSQLDLSLSETKDKLIYELKTQVRIVFGTLPTPCIAGMSREEIFSYCAVDPWFLVQMEELIALEKQVAQMGLKTWTPSCCLSSSAKVSPMRAWRSCWA